MELTQAVTIATNLLKEHGLIAQGWGVKLGRGSRRLGLCSYRHKTIKIARHHVLNGTDAEVLDTIRHEVAHALAGSDAMHGPIWKNLALKLGAIPYPVKHIKYQIPTRYTIVCTKCERILQHRINKISPQRMNDSFCKYCGYTSRGQLVMKYVDETPSIL